MSDEGSAADQPSWHDNLIYGLHLHGADPERGIWRSDLLLDIDHIVEWVRGTDGGMSFRVAPANLVFHDVRDLKIDVDFSGRDMRENLNELSIAQILVRPDPDPQQTTGSKFGHWRIELNLPQGSEITFYASGYTQTLRAPAQLVDQQRLPPDGRPPLEARNTD